MIQQKTNRVVKKFIFGAILFILAAILFTSPTFAYVGDPPERLWTNRMEEAHIQADELRAQGYAEDSKEIKELSAIWWQEYWDMYIIGNVIQHEAGYCTWEHKVYVGAVVVNRKNSDPFPPTVYAVVVAPNQYSPSYVENLGGVQTENLQAAVVAMNGDHDAPEDLWWQAEFPQGKEIWKTIEFNSVWDYHSTTYFCRGSIYY